MVRTKPSLRIKTPLPARSAPSVPAVKASSGIVARRPSTELNAESRSKAQSAGFGWISRGISQSIVFDILAVRQWRLIRIINTNSIDVTSFSRPDAGSEPALLRLDSLGISNYVSSTLSERVLTADLRAGIRRYS